MTPAITLKNITKVFEEEPSRRVVALEGITLEIFYGEIFVFLGPSGCGKSTLLRIMSGLEKEYKGEIRLDPALETSALGFIFQQFALFPWLTVSENIGLGLWAKYREEKVRQEKIKSELKRLGLEKFENAYPRELSGGMKQRVGIARALAVDPKVIFMDEPFSELDSFTAEELRKEVLKIWEEKRPTIVMVTHLIEEALELADRIAVLTTRPGRIEKIIQNSLPRPRQKRSPDFWRLEDELHRLLKP